MADTVAVTKETTKVGTPEKKKDVEKKVEEVDEDSKTSDNGVDKPKENGTDEKDGAGDSKDKDDSSVENGDSKDSVEVSATKRKSEGGDAPDAAKVEGASPEKKAKLEEKKKEVDAPTANGEAEAVA